MTLAAIQNVHTGKLGKWSGFEQTLTANPNAFYNGWANDMSVIDPDNPLLGYTYTTAAAASTSNAASATSVVSSTFVAATNAACAAASLAIGTR